MLFKDFYNLFLENSSPRSYSCFMLDCQFLIHDFNKIHEDICPCEVYDSEPGHGLEKEPHITVKYGLHEESAANIFKGLELKPIKFKLSKLSLFQNEDFDVLKFDIESKGLHKLNEEVCKKFAYTDKYPKYHPHMTVGYLIDQTGKFYLGKKNGLIGKEFVSNRFMFSDKNGNKTYHEVI